MKNVKWAAAFVVALVVGLSSGCGGGGGGSPAVVTPPPGPAAPTARLNKVEPAAATVVPVGLKSIISTFEVTGVASCDASKMVLQCNNTAVQVGTPVCNVAGSVAAATLSPAKPFTNGESCTVSGSADMTGNGKTVTVYVSWAFTVEQASRVCVAPMSLNAVLDVCVTLKGMEVFGPNRIPADCPYLGGENRCFRDTAKWVASPATAYDAYPPPIGFLRDRCPIVFAYFTNAKGYDEVVPFCADDGKTWGISGFGGSSDPTRITSVIGTDLGLLGKFSDGTKWEKQWFSPPQNIWDWKQIF